MNPLLAHTSHHIPLCSIFKSGTDFYIWGEDWMDGWMCGDVRGSLCVSVRSFGDIVGASPPYMKGLAQCWGPQTTLTIPWILNRKDG